MHRHIFGFVNGLHVFMLYVLSHGLRRCSCNCLCMCIYCVAIWVASRENTWLYRRAGEGLRVSCCTDCLVWSLNDVRDIIKLNVGSTFLKKRREKGNHFQNHPEEAHDIWTNMNPGRDWELAHAKVGGERRGGFLIACLL